MFIGIAIGLVSLNPIHSQTILSLGELSGKIIAVENNQTVPLHYATVRLLAAKDSTLISGTTTDQYGRYEFRSLRDNDYLLLVSSVGYLNIYQPVSVSEIQNNILLPDILLSENSITLKEATITAKRAEMIVKNDTVEFNASSYRLNENAVVEDLLMRLPGIIITEDGKILVNGKEVTKVMVDGKDFFRSNPNLSIKNIPAQIMDKLQIIDDKSELSKLTGVDDDEENITINITIQKDKKRGWLVSNNIGAGKELNSNEGNLMRYSVNTFAARLMNESQLGIVANGNNINGMNVGSGGSNSGSGKSGLNSSLSGGINFSSGKDKDTPWVFNGDLSYGFNERKLRRSSIRQYYLQDSTSFQTDTIEQISREEGIRFSAKLESHALENWTFSFSPSASYTSTYENNEGYTLLQAGNLYRDSVNRNRYNRISTTPSLSLRSVLTVTHDFEKKRRKLSLSLDTRYSNSEGTGETNANYYYFRNQPDSREKIINQQWENNSTNFYNRLYLSYIEPLGEKNSLQFAYWIKSNDRENIKNNYKPDLVTGEYKVLDLPYSKSFDNNELTQQLRVSFRGVFKKVVYTLGLDYNPAYIRSRSFIQNGAISGADSTITYFPGLQNYNYAPKAYLMYNIGDGKSLRFDYRGRSESPSVEQLDPSPDETNPSHIRIGNPDLLPQFTHRTRLRFNNNNKEKQQSIQVHLEGEYTENDIINFTNYDGTSGVKTVTPVNMSGSWNTTGTLIFNRPLSKLFQINNYTRLGVRNNIGFSTIDGNSSSQKTVATTFSFNEDLGLTFKWEWLYLLAKATYQANSTTYSIENMLSKKTSQLGSFLTTQINLSGSLSVSSGLNYRYLKGFSAEYDRQEFIWNAEISKSFLKSKAATVTLMLNDILQQQLSVTQKISSNYVEDQQQNTLKSFVMLVFSYKFNTMGKEK
ncbi:MAG: outer membrane beta-barrel protein [Paludibacter sp.]|nr:outer membrane beta-barrel protein [Paludibacter sp.]